MNRKTNTYNKYNTIGQLAKDTAGGIDTVLWTVYGKIKEVKKYDGDSLIFAYDPMGNRIEKRFYPHGGIADTTIYVRDAQGNILATYDRRKDTVRLTEWDMYGSKRVGSVDTTMRVFPKVPVNIAGSIDSTTVAYLENQKQYELDNYLGNVMATISDKKIPIDTTGTPNIANYYLPNIVSANILSAYGAPTYGLSYQVSKDSSYKYGYQGSLKDNEIEGKGNVISTKNREEDVQIPNWWTRDPVTHADQSPYITMGDNPILKNDVLGNTDNSTHTDEKGNVLAVYDDKDKGVYVHKGAKSKADIDKNYSTKNTSAGGKKVGETLTPLSFANFEIYDKTHQIQVPKGTKIDFGSTWATDQVSGILKDPFITTYIWNARGGHAFDLKTQVPRGNSSYYGSLLFGKYASARDAGNFLAGAEAQGSILPTAAFDYVYGAYNLSGNNLWKATGIMLGNLLNIATTPAIGVTQAGAIMGGENTQSQVGIDAGKSWIIMGSPNIIK